MVELSEHGLRLIEALLAGTVAWQSPSELASAIGGDLDETNDLLAVLDAGGWLAAWDREAELVVTLTVAGAARLGVRLVEVGHAEVPRWARRGDPEPPRPKASGVFRGERAAALELVVDPWPAPGEVAERTEEALARSAIPSDPRERAIVEGLPRPTLLVGLGLSPWPGPGDGRKASCPSCGSKRLEPSMYCLHCDRWGLDHLLRDEPAPRARARPAAATAPKGDLARRDLERQARKVRRRARRFDQAEAATGAARRPRRAAP